MSVAVEQSTSALHAIVSCVLRVQALEIISSEIREELERLALDVADELHDSYPEELSRPALRDICGRRPSPRQRSRLRAQTVRKFEHLSPRERYERACAHAELLPGALRMTHLMLQEHLADLAATALHVRSRLPATLLCCATVSKSPSAFRALGTARPVRLRLHAQDCCAA